VVAAPCETAPRRSVSSFDEIHPSRPAATFDHIIDLRGAAIMLRRNESSLEKIYFKR
jgi:hypothetical protein